MFGEAGVDMLFEVLEASIHLRKPTFDLRKARVDTRLELTEITPDCE